MKPLVSTKEEMKGEQPVCALSAADTQNTRVSFLSAINMLGWAVQLGTGKRQ